MISIYKRNLIYLGKPDSRPYRLVNIGTFLVYVHRAAVSRRCHNPSKVAAVRPDIPLIAGRIYMPLLTLFFFRIHTKEFQLCFLLFPVSLKSRIVTRDMVSKRNFKLMSEDIMHCDNRMDVREYWLRATTRNGTSANTIFSPTHCHLSL